ncbi:MAG: FtsX-like permease family protein [Candidatus Heimdallarchaeota archaeon]|nr:FtsX-like permease family protein [Candidatus Heimdallarchaeota archaeon]
MIEFLIRLPRETIPMTFHSIWRNKRRSFAMLAGIMLAISLLSGIILYNNELKQSNYESIVGDFPYEVYFDILGDESQATLQSVRDEVAKDDRVIDTTILGAIDSNERNNWIDVEVFNYIDLQEADPSGADVRPYWVDTDDFFGSDIAQPLINMEFQGTQDLTADSVIISEQLARRKGFEIGESIPLINITQTIYYDFNDLPVYIKASIGNLTIVGTYNAQGMDGSIQSGMSDNPFFYDNVFMSMEILDTAPMTQLHESMREVGNFYVATKLDVTKFSIDDPTLFNREIEQFINQITKASQYELRGDNEIEATIFAFQFYSVFVTFLYMLLSTPVIILSIYLLNFGLEMSLEERRRLVAIKKVQGANSRQIFAELRNETLLLLLLGSVIGYIGGILSAWIISSAVGFMELSIGSFTNFLDYLRFDLTAYLLPLLSVSALLIVVTYKKGRVFIESEVTQGVTQREIKKESFFRKNKFDIWIFLASLSGIGIILIDELKLEISDQISTFTRGAVFTVTPFAFWIAGASVGSRLVKTVPLKLEKSFLRLPVFKDVKRVIKSGLKRRGDIDRLALIIILTLSIAAMATIQGNTEELVAQRELEWNTGSDWLVNFQIEGDFRDNLTNIDGFEAAIGGAQIRANSLSSSFRVVAFDNHEELSRLKAGNPVIKWQSDNFNAYNAEEALQLLEDHPNGVFVMGPQLFALDAEVGDTIEIRITESNQTHTKYHRVDNIEVLGTVNQLPGGFSNNMLVSEDLFQKFKALELGLPIDAFAGVPINASQYYVKTNAGAAISDEKIKEIQIELEKNDYIQYEKSYEYELRKINTLSEGFGVSGLLSLNFIISLVASLVSAFSFSAILMERRKQEFAILRAIGAKKRHIYKLALGENTLMMVTASIWGVFIGIGVAYLFNGIFIFVGLFVGAATDVARTVYLPGMELLIIMLITLFGMLFATLLSIRSAANQDLAMATKVV